MRLAAELPRRLKSSAHVQWLAKGIFPSDVSSSRCCCDVQVLMKMTLPEPSPLPIDPASIQKEMWAPGRTKFTLEPMFVPRRGATAEDDGYILLLVHNGETGGTELAILDARKVSEGAIKLPRRPF